MGVGNIHISDLDINRIRSENETISKETERIALVLKTIDQVAVRNLNETLKKSSDEFAKIDKEIQLVQSKLNELCATKDQLVQVIGLLKPLKKENIDLE